MQATSDKTASANFTQTGGTANVRGITGNVTNGKTGYNPYYQQGRKDAFKSADPASPAPFTFSGTAVTVGTSIQTPTTQYNSNGSGYGNPYNPFYYNAWNATYPTYNATTDKIDGLEKVVKTVYDPCPVGYTVSPGNTFTALNTTNTPVDGKGRNYTVNGKELYFLYAGGHYADDGKFNGVGTFGYYYLAAVASTATMSCFALFNSSGVNGHQTDGGRAWALPVRPVNENVRQH